jgi:DNA-binding protein Fis
VPLSFIPAPIITRILREVNECQSQVGIFLGIHRSAST